MDGFFEIFFLILILRAKNRFWWCLQTPVVRFVPIKTLFFYSVFFSFFAGAT